MSERLTPDEIEVLMKKFPEWDNEEKSLLREFEFDEFMDGIDFVDAVAEISEEAGHHPDIDIRYSTVTLRLTTHEVGGLTDGDFDIARKVETLLD